MRYTDTNVSDWFRPELTDFFMAILEERGPTPKGALIVAVMEKRGLKPHEGNMLMRAHEDRDVFVEHQHSFCSTRRGGEPPARGDNRGTVRAALSEHSDMGGDTAILAALEDLRRRLDDPDDAVRRLESSHAMLRDLLSERSNVANHSAARTGRDRQIYPLFVRIRDIDE